MEKLVRNRKAFYEKENDHKNGNKRRDLLASLNYKSNYNEKLYQSVPQSSLRTAPKKKKVQTNSTAYCDQYGDDLLIQSRDLSKPSNCLDNHEIDGTLRARMIDWMVEVMCSYKFTNKTYFDGVNLMDRYFAAQKQVISPAQLHIIGVQSMLVASKMNEVFPLKLKTVYEKIAHKKIPMEDLVEMEERITKKLDFKLNSWTFFDLAMLKVTHYFNIVGEQKKEFLELYSTKENKSEDKHNTKIDQIEEICSYLGKFILYDYQFCNQNSAHLLSECLVKAAFEISNIECYLAGFYENSPIQIEICKQKLFKIIKNFKITFIGMNNIFKFTKKEVIAQVEANL